MVFEFDKNISKVTIDVREFMDETKDCRLSDKKAAEWLLKFREDLFFGMVDETQKRLEASKSSS